MGRRVRQAFRACLRRLPQPGPHPEGECGLVSRPHFAPRPGGRLDLPGDGRREHRQTAVPPEREASRWGANPTIARRWLDAQITQGGAGRDSGTTSKGASESTVRVWIMGDDGRKFSDLVADFTKSTNIKVQVDAIPWDNVNEKLTTAVASGNGPDVMQIGLSLLSSFQSAGALLDLTPHFGGHAKLKSENFVD